MDVFRLRIRDFIFVFSSESLWLVLKNNFYVRSEHQSFYYSGIVTTQRHELVNQMDSSYRDFEMCFLRAKSFLWKWREWKFLKIKFSKRKPSLDDFFFFAKLLILMTQVKHVFLRIHEWFRKVYMSEVLTWYTF